MRPFNMTVSLLVLHGTARFGQSHCPFWSQANAFFWSQVDKFMVTRRVHFGLIRGCNVLDTGMARFGHGHVLVCVLGINEPKCYEPPLRFIDELCIFTPS